MSEIKVNKISPKQTCTQLTLGDPLDTIIIPANTTTSVAGTLSVTGNLLSDTLKNANSSTLITQTNATTITLGFSGATIAVATGVSQSGIGRQGTVNWSSTVQTTGFTAVSGNGYFCNTTSGAFTVTLPATPTAGDIVAFKDYAKTWNTNNLTIGRNGSNIEGLTSNYGASTQGLSVTLVYVDSTKGWLVIDDGVSSSIVQPAYVAATGGTVLTCGCYKTHIFTSSGCFVVSSAGNSLGSNSVEYVVVAGGAGGGSSRSTVAGKNSGGGGAGGFRQNYPSPTTTGLPVSATTYPITVGGGGAGSSSPSAGGSGSNSVFSTITSAGGGGGGSNCTGGAGTEGSGAAGGSGGGGAGAGSGTAGTGGAGNTPPVSPSQGNTGGNGTNTTPSRAGGGGGGAGASGTSGGPTTPGDGGVGSPIATAFFGPTSPSYGTPGPAPGRYFAGGGGGAVEVGTQGAGGAGGGGGGVTIPQTPIAGTANTGGGGGGTNGGGTLKNGGAGGSGIVMIRYKFQ